MFTDIHVDPASLPAPAPEPTNVNNNSDEEEDFEEDPEEDPEMNEDESSDEPDDNMSEDEPEEAIPSFYTPGGGMPRTMLTARKSVRFPSTDYASSSRAHGRSNVRISSHTPSPTPSPVPSSPFTPRLAYSPTSPLSSPPFPGNIPEASIPVRIPSPYNPPMTAEEWITYLPSLPQPTRGASTSSAPHSHVDPAISQLMGCASDFNLRITQLEDNVEILPGPAQLEDLDLQVQDMDERLNTVEHRAYQMSNRVLARGALADVVQTIQTRLQTMDTERDFLRSRVRDLEQRIFGVHRAPR